jgi:hypothetical protein
MLYGTARSASDAVMITIGSTSAESARPPAQTVRPGDAEELHEDRQAEQAVHDRRHTGEVAHVGRVIAASFDLPAYSSR